MAATKTRLKSDLANALRAKDEFAKSVIRMMMAAITKAEVAGQVARELSDDEELAVIVKEQRSRLDSAATYAEVGRPELAEKEQREAEFMAAYLPTPLTEAELQLIVAEEIAAVPDAGMKQMGAIVKAVKTRVSGRAEGSLIASLVRAQLG